MAVSNGKKVGWSAGNLFVIAWALFPVWWLVSLSFKDPAKIGKDNGSFWPTTWSLENYRGIFKLGEFVRSLVNSIGIALISTLVAVVLATMAAYAIARLNFPGKGLLIGMSLLIAMFPQI
ncbi:MAG TPA: carbohydrate ABC transporter permease, partial [Mycobacteriales bacterium]|nr:carbohydrate ABC transporter permease [Mycobacteriales bacterium]